MLTNKQISIIIPTKNEEKHLASCLKSIKSQNIPSEIIVVDNFSKDNTLKIAKQYTKFVFQKGPERSAQRNFGAEKAKSRYLLFLDADMQLTPDLLENALTIMKKKKCIIAFGEKAIGNNFWEKSVALERNCYQNVKLLAAARFYPKKLFQKLGGFDEKLIAGEDWDLSLRAVKTGFHLVFAKNKIIHRETIKSLLDFLEKKKYYRKNIKYYQSKHPLEFQKQSSLLFRLNIFRKNWRRLLRDPLHFSGFLFLKMLIWYDWQLNKK